MAKKKKPGFMLYHRDIEALAILSDAQFGALVRAAYRYSANSEPMEPPDPMLALAYGMMSNRIDEDGARYAEICEKRREAIQSRWDAEKGRSEDGYKSIQMNTSDTNDTNTMQCNAISTTDYITNTVYRAREGGEEGEPDWLGLAAREMGNDPFAVGELEKLAKKYDAAQVYRACKRAGRDATEADPMTMRDVRRILRSWAETDRNNAAE